MTPRRSRVRVCSCVGCPAHPASCPRLTTDGGRCTECTVQSDRERGTAAARGYGGRGHRGFRSLVLDRDPICVLCNLAAATVADHYPVSRRDLVAAGRDPNDPAAGRGLCKPCHDAHTAKAQPGGWHAGTA